MNQIDPTREPVIVAAARTAIGKAKKGSLATVRPDDMAAAVIADLLKRAPALDPAELTMWCLAVLFPRASRV